MLEVRAIGYEELGYLLEMWQERSKWLRSIGEEMWDVSQLNAKSIINKYENPEFFIGFVENVQVGGFLLIEKDSRYWPDRMEDRAYYLHKFVVRLGHGGKGYSKRMLEWIKDQAEANGKQYVRLDYEIDREYLRKMYIDSGFRDIEILKKEGQSDIVKAEYRVL